MAWLAHYGFASYFISMERNRMKILASHCISICEFGCCNFFMSASTHLHLDEEICYTVSMTKEERKPYIIAICVALLIAGAAAVYKFAIEDNAVLPTELPQVGKVGSDHAHASLLIMVGDRILNFCTPDYMLKSQYVHFEDNNCSVVHRHARGVTIPTFLKTIGVGLTEECLTVPGDQKTYCNNGTEKLRAIVNGSEVAISMLPYYVFRNNDHILIDYGSETAAMLRFKYNQVPQIPLDVNEPNADNMFGKVLEEKPLENVK